jgi:hypothetical protein
VTVRMQHCDYCGEELGVFEHHSREDGPKSCSAKECTKSARDDERAAREQAMLDAADDGFARYR